MKFRLAAILLLLTLFSCSKDRSDRIPDVYVDYDISLVLFDQNAKDGVLFVPKGANTGVAGLVIYRHSNGSYKAYDRCSSVNPEQACAVIADDTSLTVLDPCSGAKFSLYDGAPVKAPAKRPLKEYRVIKTNFTLSVMNY